MSPADTHQSYVVTVFGPDRPGIIAEVTGALHRVGGNLEDSTMTILRGRLAMMLVVTAAAGEQHLQRVLAEGVRGDLQLSVRAVPAETDGASLGAPHVLSVHGADRPGIVSAVTGLVAGMNGNITDLTTRLTGDLYVLVAEVDLPADVPADSVRALLEEQGRHLGVDVSLRPAEPDLL